MSSRQLPGSDSGKVIVQYGQSELVEDDIGPPPTHLTSKFGGTTVAKT